MFIQTVVFIEILPVNSLVSVFQDQNLHSLAHHIGLVRSFLSALLTNSSICSNLASMKVGWCMQEIISACFESQLTVAVIKPMQSLVPYFYHLYFCAPNDARSEPLPSSRLALIYNAWRSSKCTPVSSCSVVLAQSPAHFLIQLTFSSFKRQQSGKGLHWKLLASGEFVFGELLQGSNWNSQRKTAILKQVPRYIFHQLPAYALPLSRVAGKLVANPLRSVVRVVPGTGRWQDSLTESPAPFSFPLSFAGA